MDEGEPQGDIDGMLELFDAVDADNLAVVLDAWHWYCAHNTLADLDKLFMRGK